MRTSESKSSNAKQIETENGNMTQPLTPGPAHSKDTIDHDGDSLSREE
tara:strand:- start:504 stop:647 length:144 start_codon:yes stop_codon:yes gene_type:complete